MYICICQNINTARLKELLKSGETPQDICKNCSCCKCVEEIHAESKKIIKTEERDGI